MLLISDSASETDVPFFAQLSLMTLMLLASIRVTTIRILKQLAGALVKCLTEFSALPSGVVIKQHFYSGSCVSCDLPSIGFICVFALVWFREI